MAFKEVELNEEFTQTPLSDDSIRRQDAVCVKESKMQHAWWHNIKYLLVGAFFGLLFVKAQVVSWFRIQEMFRFQSFHMYGIIGSAVVVAAISIWLIKRFQAKTIYGEAVVIAPKEFNKGQIIGGLTFGMGWALTGACPGPMYALVGSGASAFIVVLLSAIAGTYVYGLVRNKLPH